MPARTTLTTTSIHGGTASTSARTPSGFTTSHSHRAPSTPPPLTPSPPAFVQVGVRVLIAEIDPIVLDGAAFHPRRHYYRRSTHAQLLEVERHVAPILRHLCPRQVVACRHVDEWRHMVTETTVLVKRQDEEHLIPRAGPRGCA